MFKGEKSSLGDWRPWTLTDEAPTTLGSQACGGCHSSYHTDDVVANDSLLLERFLSVLLFLYSLEALQSFRS